MNDSARPRLAAGVRLQVDGKSDRAVLLFPEGILELNETEFRELFRDSPIKRVKRRGFLRNVCVALGNVGDATDLPALARAATDPEPLIAEHARWAINQIEARSAAAAAAAR